MNMPTYCSPTKTAQALQNGAVSPKVVLLSKVVAVLSFGIIILSVFFQPSSPSFLQTFGDIFLLIVYVGIPLSLTKKYHIARTQSLELFMLINLVSTVRMTLASVVLLLIGIIVLLPGGHTDSIYLQVADLLVWGTGMYTMYIGTRAYVLDAGTGTPRANTTDGGKKFYCQ